MAAATPTEPQTIVLIHGMWMTPLSWEHWAVRSRAQGHEVIAPAWLGLSDYPAEVRRNPSPLHGLSIPDVIDEYERIIRGLDRPPIIIGHSFGGLFTLMLLDRGLGSIGVAMEPAAPKGVLNLPPQQLKAASPAIAHPSKRKGVVTLTLDQFK